MAGKKTGRSMPPKMPRPQDDKPVYIEKTEEGYYIPGPHGRFAGSFQGSCREIAKQLILKISKDNKFAQNNYPMPIGNFWIQLKPEVKCSFDLAISCALSGIDKKDLLSQITEELKQLMVLIPFS